MTRAPRPLRGPPRKLVSRKWAREPDDWYIEEDWCDNRLFDVESFEGRIVDPACGSGRVIKAARAAGHDAEGFDLRRRPHFRHKVADFFEASRPVPNFVSNAPFKFALAFVGHALTLATRKVAILLPPGWAQADWRSTWLERTPLRRIWLLTPRPSMPPGPFVFATRAPGERVGNGTTDYAWFVWEQGYVGPWETRVLRRDDVKGAAIVAASK
jgi:hypothetical protein